MIPVTHIGMVGLYYFQLCSLYLLSMAYVILVGMLGLILPLFIQDDLQYFIIPSSSLGDLVLTELLAVMELGV